MQLGDLGDYGALLLIVFLTHLVLLSISNRYFCVQKEMAQENIRMQQEIAQAILDQNDRFHKRDF